MTRPAPVPAQTTFRDAGGCRKAVHRMLREGGPIRAVVAYWGANATEDLGILPGADLTVVCDVRSGACNVDIVKEQQRLLGPGRVLTCDRLHAKVWIAQNWAVVGLSNASANGLGFENTETRALLEANVVIDDKATVEALRVWADDEVGALAREITEADFRAAARRHRERRGRRPLPTDGTLLSQLKAAPMAFDGRGAEVWVFEHADAERWMKREIKAVQKDRDDGKSITGLTWVLRRPPAHTYSTSTSPDATSASPGYSAP